MDFSNLMGVQPPQMNFQAASGFQQTLNPPPGVPQQTPPSTPQELEQRKVGWQQFIEGVRNDPAMKTAAFMMAGQMMQGPDMGESQLGNLGRSLQLGTLAHSFMRGNQNRAALEQQKMEETRRLNDAQIAQSGATTDHTTAQTHGLYQDQQFARENRPLEVRGKELKLQSDQFDVDNQQIRLLSDLETGNETRNELNARAFAHRNKHNTVGGAKQIEHSREDKLYRQANPIQPGETPEAYEQRISSLILADQNKSKSTKGAQVQALWKYLETADESDPMRPMVLRRLRELGTTDELGRPMKDVIETHQPTKLDGEVEQLKAAAKVSWDKARTSVPIGKYYKGPDGETYQRLN